MWNTGLDEPQAGIKIAGRNINSLRYTNDTTLIEKSGEELKSFVMKVKKESEKVGLKLSIQKTKILASSPITSWQIDGETMNRVTDFICLGSKINADGECSHEIKWHLLFGRKSMTNLDSILKSRDITLLTKVYLVKARLLLGPELDQKAEHQRIDAFKLWCWRRLLRIPWTARRYNQSILKESSHESFIGRTGVEAETPIFGRLIWRADLLGKTLMLGNIWWEDKGMTKDEMVGWHHWFNRHEFEKVLGVGDG